MKEIQAPKFISDRLATIFLAGSIDMGTAELWQEKAVALLANTKWTVLNPRRADWNSSWEQKISNEQFYEQVSWELQGIEQAEWVIIYFDAKSSSPITLMELGICAASKPDQTIVICPEGFYRKGNVDIVCDRYRIKQSPTLEEAVRLIR